VWPFRRLLAGRVYKSRAKNAQEAHEAIRPTKPTSLRPGRLPSGVDADQVSIGDTCGKGTAAPHCCLKCSARVARTKAGGIHLRPIVSAARRRRCTTSSGAAPWRAT
jgi:hypothetical protein